jgi:hypothetical protein
MHAIVDWFKLGSYFGVPRWVFAALTLMAIVEWALGRSKHPQARSLAAMVANVLRFLVVKSKVGMIPVVGGLLVTILEFVAGTDLDGDGQVVGVSPTPPAVTPTASDPTVPNVTPPETPKGP